MKNNKREIVITTLVCLLPVLAGIALYSRLPEQVPTHFDFNGTANGWSSKSFAVFGLPLMMAGFNLFLQFGLRTDPKRQNMNTVLRNICVWICPVLSVLVYALVMRAGLGYITPTETIVPLLVGILFVVIGNYLPKTKQSYTMGIKLPWTLASEENWNRTHRLAGFLWVIGGILLILLTLLRLWNTWTFLLVIIPMSVVPMIYSYLLYRKGI